MNRLIVFPILALNERAIIHEVNHAITRDIIAFVMEGNTHIGAVSKVGLSIDVAHQNNGERIIEELINEKTSEEIGKIFKSKGGNFSSFCLDISLAYVYEYNYYLIDDFYNQFKKYIKTSRISDNKNELIARVGQDEYKRLVELVNKYYTEDVLQIEPNKARVLPSIRKLVEQMSKNVDNSHAASKDEKKAYLEQLLKSGYNLRIIDSQYNQPENSELERNNGTKKR